MQQGYLYRTKAKMTSVYVLKIELVVKMVFEVKSAVDCLPPYIYNYCFGPSSPITQNLARENDLLAWSILAMFIKAHSSYDRPGKKGGKNIRWLLPSLRRSLLILAV